MQRPATTSPEELNAWQGWEISSWDRARKRFPVISPVPCTFHFLLVMLNQDTFDFRLGGCQREIYFLSEKRKDHRLNVARIKVCFWRQRSLCLQRLPCLELLSPQAGIFVLWNRISASFVCLVAISTLSSSAMKIFCPTLILTLGTLHIC